MAAATRTNAGGSGRRRGEALEDDGEGSRGRVPKGWFRRKAQLSPNAPPAAPIAVAFGNTATPAAAAQPHGPQHRRSSSVGSAHSWGQDEKDSSSESSSLRARLRGFTSVLIDRLSRCGGAWHPACARPGRRCQRERREEPATAPARGSSGRPWALGCGLRLCDRDSAHGFAFLSSLASKAAAQVLGASALPAVPALRCLGPLPLLSSCRGLA
jgi:hypothetical protein